MRTKITAIWTRRGVIAGALGSLALALLPWRSATAPVRGIVIKQGWVLRADD